MVRKKTSKKIYLTLLSILAVLAIVASSLTGVIIGENYITSYYGVNNKKFEDLMWLKEQIKKNYYIDITDEQFYDACINGVNDTLLDDYSYFMNSEQYASYLDDSNGESAGIGLSIVKNNLQIYKVVYNSPAHKVGIKDGMYLRTIGEATENMQEITSVNGSLYDGFASKLSTFATDEEFYLGISTTPDGNITNYKLSKKSYQRTYVKFATNEKTYTFESDDYSANTKLVEKDEGLSNLPDGTMYLRLDEFMGKASTEINKAMDKFYDLNCKDLIIDLRNNGGGQLSILQKILKYFLKDATEDKNPVCVAKYKDGTKKVYYSSLNYYNDYFQEDSSIKILANKNSASASEAFIGALIDYGTITYDDIYLSEIDGVAKTYGKGIMQTIYPQFNGDVAVKLTTAQIFWPKSDTSIHGVGLLASNGCNVNLNAKEVEYGDSELENFLSSLG